MARIFLLCSALSYLLSIFLDAGRRATNWEQPQIHRNCETLFKNVTNHKKVQCILDIPVQRPHVPGVLQHVFLLHSFTHSAYYSSSQIDDSYQRGWIDLLDIFHYISTAPLDTSLTRSWELWHLAGYFTYAHHDAEGSVTHMIVRSGVKMWAVIRPLGYAQAKNRAQLNKFNNTFRPYESKRTTDSNETYKFTAPQYKNHHGEADEFVIHAEPGDLMSAFFLTSFLPC